MRVIAQEARVFLLDEPASNLDVRYRPDVMDMVAGIIRGRNAAACAIIYDLNLTLRCCNKILMIRDGEVFASGPTDDVMTAENVRTVYGVDVAVEDVHGRRRVIACDAGTRKIPPEHAHDSSMLRHIPYIILR